jgi:hypothetical protein
MCNSDGATMGSKGYQHRAGFQPAWLPRPRQWNSLAGDPRGKMPSLMKFSNTGIATACRHAVLAPRPGHPGWVLLHIWAVREGIAAPDCRQGALCGVANDLSPSWMTEHTIFSWVGVLEDVLDAQGRQILRVPGSGHCSVELSRIDRISLNNAFAWGAAVQPVQGSTFLIYLCYLGLYCTLNRNIWGPVDHCQRVPLMCRNLRHSGRRSKTKVVRTTTS